MVLTDYEAARIAVKNEEQQNRKIHYIFTAADRPMEEREVDDTDSIIRVNVHVNGGTDEDILNGVELYLKNADVFQNITDLTATGKR